MSRSKSFEVPLPGVDNAILPVELAQRMTTPTSCISGHGTLTAYKRWPLTQNIGWCRRTLLPALVAIDHHWREPYLLLEELR